MDIMLGNDEVQLSNLLIPLLLEVLKLWKLVLHLFLKNSTTHKNIRCLGSYFCTYGFNQLTYKTPKYKTVP